jgi:hypothetical protein
MIDMSKDVLNEVRNQRGVNLFQRVQDRRKNHSPCSDILTQVALKNQEIHDLKRKLECMETEIRMFKAMVEVQNEIKAGRI